MNDIVERLRDAVSAHGNSALCREAAAEIERLTAHIGTLIQEREQERKFFNDAIADHLAEIERLRAALTDISLMKMPWTSMPAHAKRALDGTLEQSARPPHEGIE